MADNWFSKQVVRPLEERFGALLGGQRDTRLRPTETIGHMGTAIFGGYVVENEKEGALTDRERYRTFSEILANCSIAAAGVRYFLNLAAKAEWDLEAADHERGEELAELAKDMLFEDPTTPWGRIVRRAAMYRFYGFSLQEWTMTRRDDGLITFKDIAPRAQITIERWDVNTDGSINGVVQRNPQNQEETYLPRAKTVYLVDDSLNDSPQGLGLFRHIVEPAKRLLRYEQLEGFGFETDLRGTPIGRAPFAELRRRVAAGEMNQAEAEAATAGIMAFMKKHIKNPELGLVVDSEVYTTTDDATRPSNQAKFDVQLLEATSTGLGEVARAVERLNREIARVLGVEAILLGGGERGSFALSQDKTNQFLLTVNATLSEIGDAFEDDLLVPLWEQNGWPIEAMPTLKHTDVQFREIEAITRSLRDMAQAGAVLMPDDPVINEVRGMVGLSPMDETSAMLDAAITDPPQLVPVQQPQNQPTGEEE